MQEGEFSQSRSPVDPDDPGFCADDWFLPLELPFKAKHHCRDSKKYWKRLKQVLAVENEGGVATHQVNYATVEAGPSIYPSKKYCDLTGFQAAYTDPKTKLRYCAKDLYPVVRSTPNETVQAKLAIRNAHVVLK
ncbi:hypothetical protein BSKO_00834 [Bryopsis sp. KO-2023]|nr:hypothetical protein BSKO_00834 [Bryopsis sp. KO-2023]